ncbi:hypothetical protein QYE76_001715 [Lolium multiflorum]|uniref:Uncharacterized protein n=1 Tax=Lolium multiflorum TaxID=4521 RepID=A0AAD8RMB2_LOLMU|nr:hypothetical protein QYE76_001715 [Lolium multiflorum]
MTMAWALTALLRRPDAAAAATEKLDRIVGPTGGGEASDAGRDAQRRSAPTLVAHSAATPWPAKHGGRIFGARSPIKVALAV